MPKKKPTPSRSKPYQIYQRFGLKLSAPRIESTIRKRYKHIRLGQFASISLTTMIETILRYSLREAIAQAEQDPKMKQSKQAYITLKARHLSDARHFKRSMVYGVLPKKVAGVYSKAYGQ